MEHYMDQETTDNEVVSQETTTQDNIPVDEQIKNLKYTNAVEIAKLQLLEMKLKHEREMLKIKCDHEIKMLKIKYGLV